MLQYGVVTQTNGENATVRFMRTKACVNCGACMTIGESEAQVEIPNTLHARVGDSVRVELHEKGLLRAGLLAYILPLCALLLGIALGIQISNVAGMLIGLGSAVLVYVLLHLLEPRFARMETLRPRMISIESNQETVGGKEDVQ